MRQPIPVPEQHRALAEHYRRSFGEPAACVRWTLGPVHELPEDHVVLEWKPRVAGGPWTYATAGMSSADARTDPAVEVHLLAPGKDDAHVELLTVLTHFHVTGPGLGMGHSVNFGRPWLPGSACTYGLLSRPYLKGPEFETFGLTPAGTTIQCLWLIPLTPSEIAYKQQHGLDALEERMRERRIAYLDPKRDPVV